MGAKISKRYSSYKSQPKAFKLFPNFLPNSPHKTSLGIFDILKIEILMTFFSFSLTWDPMGAKISNHYSSYKSQPKDFKLFLNFLPKKWPSQKYAWDFWNFENWNSNDFLALLDYFSRAHGMGSLSVVRHPSSVRLWHRLSLNPLHRFLSDFGCCFPVGHMPDAFLYFWFFFFFDFFLWIFFLLINMGPHGSQNF